MFANTNEYTDSIGLLYLRARYYDPKMGRFFQLDTWRGDNNRPQSLNPYMYTEGNPVNFTDPSGLKKCWGLVCQDNPPISLPYELAREGDNFWTVWEYLEFEPDRDFSQLRNMLEGIYTGQESIVENMLELIDSGQINIEDMEIGGVEYKSDDIMGMLESMLLDCDENACATAVIAALACNIQGTCEPHPALALINRCNQPILSKNVKEVAEMYGLTVDGIEPLTKWPSTNPQLIFDTFGSIRQHLDNGWVVTQVGINGSDIASAVDYPRHFVAILGLTPEEEWKDGRANWRWVKVYDPMDDQVEYHILNDFWNYANDSLIYIH